jgi:hypothetical protein
MGYATAESRGSLKTVPVDPAEAERSVINGYAAPQEEHVNKIEHSALRTRKTVVAFPDMDHWQGAGTLKALGAFALWTDNPAQWVLRMIMRNDHADTTELR